MRPGVYKDMSWDDYRAADGVNMSRLKAMRKSPLHYKTDRPVSARPETLLLGSLIHAAVLEPLEIPKHYVVEPDWRNHADNVDATGKQSTGHTAWVKDRKAEFADANVGKHVVTQQQYDSAVACSKAVSDNHAASEMLRHRGGKPEVSIFWEDAPTGLLCKARIDWLLVQLGRLVDVKTCEDRTTFQHSFERLAYPAQMAFYVDGYAKLTGELLDPWIVAIEKDLPHCVMAQRVSKRAMSDGRRLYGRWLRRVAECEDRGEWPGYECSGEWDYRPFARPSFQLNVSGVPVNEE